jgi:hypothetical protein
VRVVDRRERASGADESEVLRETASAIDARIVDVDNGLAEEVRLADMTSCEGAGSTRCESWIGKRAEGGGGRARVAERGTWIVWRRLEL